jgi:phosphopantetheine adenylyltransferase
MARTTKNYPRDVEKKLDKVAQDIRKDIARIEDPKGQALFETAAEVIIGLKTAFEHYEARSEKAWK